MPRRRLLPLTLLALLAAADPAAAGWGADRAQTRAGTATAVRVAAGAGDRVLVGWQRRLGAVQRAELRLGRARDGLVRAPSVLDASRGSVEAPVATPVRDGGFAVAWRRYERPNQRLRLRTVDRLGRLGATTAVTTTGESAHDAVWVPGAVPVLAWSRRTRADALELAPTGPRGLRLPVAPFSEPGLTAGPDGLATVAWIDDLRVLVSDRGPDAFGFPEELARGDVNLPEVLRLPGGATLVFWRESQDLVVAVRPAGGSFGPARPVLRGTTDGAQLAVTATGEVLVVTPVGDSSLVGQLRLVRLGADGAQLGPVHTLGRGRRAQLAADATGSAFVVWMGEGAERPVTARRIAAGGILGAPVLLAARTDPTSSPRLAATREGGAVVAWTSRGDVRARTYRRG